MAASSIPTAQELRSIMSNDVVISCKETRYDWQGDALREWGKTPNGLYNIIAPMGVGKTRFIVECILQSKTTENYILLPTKDRNLLRQHYDQLCIRLGHSLPGFPNVEFEYNGTKQKIYFKLCNVHNLKLLDKKRNINIFVDEIDRCQTEFGLRHAPSKFCHYEGSIKSLKNRFKKDPGLFARLINFSSNNKLTFLSATMDNIICEELISYYGLIPINNIIINVGEHYQYIKIMQGDYRDLQRSIRERKKIIIFAAKIADQVGWVIRINRWLEEWGLERDIYYWNSKKATGPFSNTITQNSDICIFVNKGNVGLDTQVENVFIDRKLSDCGSCSLDEDIYKDEIGRKRILSNLGQQICGRIRINGCVYWLKDKTIPTDTTLKKVISDRITYMLSLTIQNRRRFASKLNIENKLANKTEQYFVRSWVLNTLFTKNYGKRRGKEGSLLLMIQKTLEEYSEEYLNINVDYEDGSYEQSQNITRCLELEQVLIGVYREYIHNFGMSSIFEEIETTEERDERLRLEGEERFRALLIARGVDPRILEAGASIDSAVAAVSPNGLVNELSANAGAGASPGEADYMG
jgi:hypothetical protein